MVFTVQWQMHKELGMYSVFLIRTKVKECLQFMHAPRSLS